MSRPVHLYNPTLARDPDLQTKLFEGYEFGYMFFKNFFEVDHTALDAANAYYYGKRHKRLSKENDANYNNRWLQFEGPFEQKTQSVVDSIHNIIGSSAAHVYANWIANGHQYGRHKDMMDVLILQTWNKVAYCVESPYGGQGHHSYVLEPGDAIYIRAGTYHTPVIFGERMTLSFSW